MERLQTYSNGDGASSLPTISSPMLRLSMALPRGLAQTLPCPLPNHLDRDPQTCARAIAGAVNAVMAEGYVTSEEVRREVAGRTGREWTKRQMRDVLERLRRMKVLAIVPRGPFADRRYSSRPLRRDTTVIRSALTANADEWAVGVRPLFRSRPKRLGTAVYGMQHNGFLEAPL